MLFAFVMVSVFMIPTISAPICAEGQTDTFVMFDMGDGQTYWYDLPATGNLKQMTEEAASAQGLGLEWNADGLMSVSGRSACSVGGQLCHWQLYVCTDSGWRQSYPSDYSGGSFAWGFYPDGLSPTETPDSRVSWTMHRGDSSSTGISDSFGTLDAKSPMEWYRTYTTGYVDSGLVVAGDYLYHTTGGVFGATGSDKNPWVYCLNRFDGSIVWEFMMTYGQGYEVTTPLIVDDMLIVTATNWSVYCFDRFTGEVLHKLVLEPDYPYDSEGDVMWDGRTFQTGATTPVYDSGAVYFGTSDGHVMAYSIDRESGFGLLWDYDPEVSESNGEYTGKKGCFYFHAPVISDIDGRRMLFIGSYEGYVHALDACTGEEIWAEQLIDLGENNVPHPGAPGSAGSISVTSEGKLLVSCDDSAMSPREGFVVCIDGRTGKGPGGSDFYWKLDVMFGGPVVTEDAIYSYLSPSASGAVILKHADGTESEVTEAVYKLNLDGEVEWVSKVYQQIKPPLTLADGVLYMNDYSAGGFWPNGGGVTALSIEDGSEEWRIRLSPYTNDSFSMVAATVIDGKIYVGNDYGAVYCISEIAGPEFGDDGEIRLGNGLLHWSWLVLMAVVAVSLFFLWRFY